MAEKHRLNILVVDRDEGCTAEVKDYLTGEGYQVQALTEPDQVLDEIKLGHFQLVLLDVSPAAVGGLELLDEIRKADSDLCVIAMTDVPSVEVAVRTLKSQAFDYIQKPLEMEELGQLLGAAIREKGLQVDIEQRLNQAVGKRLREKRSGATLTLKQLANRTGLSVSLISQIELGKSAASMSTLHKLSTALQIKMTYFFETL